MQPRHEQPLPAAPHRWLLGAVMLTTVAVGWHWPFLGFVVPVAMATAVAVSFSRGRYACGHLCPRGSFFDTFFARLAGRNPIPAALRRPAVRWGIFAGLMGFMATQLARDPGNPAHWGFVFWLACAVTTAIGIGLGLRYQARTWCALCPIGTLSAKLGAGQYPLQIAESCKTCQVCESVCPMELSIAAHRAAGELPHADCLKCSRCHARCPQGALSWPEAA